MSKTRKRNTPKDVDQDVTEVIDAMAKEQVDPDEPAQKGRKLTPAELKAAVSYGRYRATRYGITDPDGVHIPVHTSVKLEKLSPYLQAQLEIGLIKVSDA